MEARAVTKYVRVSPQKARLVADLIRGKTVSEAYHILRYTPRKAARIIYKTLASAVANAEETKMMDVDNLYVSKIYVNEGPRLRRWRARAMGRVRPIVRRLSHITVVVAEK
ncbi:MAG: 50S ribosomal protein L22 [Syntrophobacterales bacterium]|nr:50S ribosomal protein L22 [Syntrophobacterales bacterium]